MDDRQAAHAAACDLSRTLRDDWVGLGLIGKSLGEAAGGRTRPATLKAITAFDEAVRDAQMRLMEALLAVSRDMTDDLDGREDGHDA